MPADRSQRKPRAGPSTPRPGPAGATEVHKPFALQHRTADGIPGLSKLKASIRQTKRFLAKEGLEPGLKIQTQRRLESLEADLAKSEKRNVEMKNGTKYHKVKFFERQKLLRIIKKQQRQVDKPESSSIKVQAAEEKLEHARVMLNYVLNFPNTEKYISLFPPAPIDSSEPEQKAHLPKWLDTPSSSTTEMDKPTRRRLEILHEMQRLMGIGKLSKTPEVELAAGEGKVRVDLGMGEVGEKGKRSRKDEKDDDDDDDDEDEDEGEGKIKESEKVEVVISGKERKRREKKSKAVEEDRGVKGGKKTKVVDVSVEKAGGDDFFED